VFPIKSQMKPVRTPKLCIFCIHITQHKRQYHLPTRCVTLNVVYLVDKYLKTSICLTYELDEKFVNTIGSESSVDAFAYLRKTTISFVMSVRL
jgi:hypothetical protein